MISEADHVLVIDLLLQIVLAHATLRRPGIDQRLLLVICLLLVLGVQRFAIASSRHFAKVLIRQLSGLIIRLPVILIASLVAIPVIMHIGRLFVPLRMARIAALLLAGTSFLATGHIALQVCVLDLSLVGCGPLLLRISFPRMISILSSILLLVKKLDLLLLLGFLLLLKLLLKYLLLLVLELPISLLPIQDRIAHHLCSQEIDLVVADEVLDGFSAIVDLAELDEQRDQVEKLLIFNIIVPRNNWNGLLRLQHVSRRRVIEDDSILRTSSDLAHVFREHALHVCAVLTEEAGCAESIGIHLVHERISVFGQTRREYNDLVVVGHHAEEIVDARSLLHEDLANVAVNVYWDDEVGVLDLIKLAMHQRLIKIQHECLHAFAPLGWCSQQAPARLLLPLVIASLCPWWNLNVAALRFGPVFRRVLLVHHGHGIYLSLWHLRYHCLQLLHCVYTEKRATILIQVPNNKLFKGTLLFRS